ncbi:hypothetical protein NA78x_006281 [Anatilimnocola sp. NA78]|uniref:hypothetical protein n=1 Tax=Anatilimnocola sp. NA78 TaxID=3415683 RepID=UPI003CE4E487
MSNRRSSQTPPTKLVLSQRPEEAKLQLLREIPVGTDMSTAVEQLKAFGFRIDRESANECIARRTQPSAPFVDISWIVTILGEHGKLSDLEVKVGFTGP